MGKKDANHANTEIEKYRKQLGKSEFKGRSKRNTLAIRNKAQAKKSDSSLLDGLVLLGILLTSTVGIYMFFYFYFSK